jgi:hypothetical protein
MLGKLARELGPDLRVITSVESGTPAPHLVGYARRHGIDLIVVGTHGRTGMSRVLIGSVAGHVVRTAPCPVLTVPALGADAAVPVEPEQVDVHRCLVCAKASPDQICEACRARIRGEAPERKQREEREGRA